MQAMSFIVKGLGAIVLAVVLAAVGAGSVINAASCGKKIKTVPQELVGDGSQVQITCAGLNPEGGAVTGTCFAFYWRTPTHPECDTGTQDWCCRNVKKKAKYYSGACTASGSTFVCTYGASADAPADAVAPEYLEATLHPCNNGEPHDDCGEFAEEPDDPDGD